MTSVRRLTLTPHNSPCHVADEFYAVMKKTRLPQGDFPNLAKFCKASRVSLRTA